MTDALQLLFPLEPYTADATASAGQACHELIQCCRLSWAPVVTCEPFRNNFISCSAPVSNPA